MTEKIEKLFSSKEGKALYQTVISTVRKENMELAIKKGVLIGFSGGADSVMLLCFFYKYRNENPGISLLAAHVNHMIRGEEAKRDLQFSESFANELNVEFKPLEINIPTIAAETKCGIEETARKERYKVFNDIISGRNDINTIAVAHNSTDNAETVIFNMLRGSGLKGISGIPPVRDNIVRPLIRISKKEIEDLLLKFEIPFVTDSTNLSMDYSRNYIRHEILPRLQRISPSPEDSLLRMSDILRKNASYFDLLAEDFLSVRQNDGYILLSELLSAAPALQSEIVRRFLEKNGSGYEYTHISKICELLDKGDFSYDIPGGFTFVSEYGKCFIVSKEESIKNGDFSFSYPLRLGLNEFKDFDGAIILSENEITDSYSKIYKIAIQQSFPFDIINKGLIVRSKEDGDSYRYSGMSHKLKKLFNDKKIPPSMRALVPIICDKEGILWPIGFPVRDGIKSAPENRCIYIALAFKLSPSANKTLYFKQNNYSKKKGS